MHLRTAKYGDSFSRVPKGDTDGRHELALPPSQEGTAHTPATLAGWARAP